MAMVDPIDPSTSSSSLLSPRDPHSLIHSRREPFDHGLLPIPKLIFADPTQTLIPLKQKLLHLYPNHRINSAAISDFFQISTDHARLVLDSLASVHHSESDPIVGANSDEIDLIGADVHDLLMFLYIQSYKRLLPRTHKDAASVADVWPSTSAFDGYLSALTPLQLVRSNSRRSMSSQSDEEAHQLSYIQKHLGNILSLLAEPVDEEGKETMVLTMNGFEHLGFLVQFGENGSDGVQLSQFAPFFANSDPDMSAAPVPATQVHDWMIQNISYALEHISERASPKDSGASATDQDVPMTDACTSSFKVLTNARSPSFIEGVSKSSLVKQASELNGSSVKGDCKPWARYLNGDLIIFSSVRYFDMLCTFVKLVASGISLKVLNCHDSVIYILSPMKYATIYGCSDTTIVLGAIGKAVRIEHCERVHVIAVAKRVCIANCRECLFHLGVNQRPLIVGDNHKLQVAPYNTFYSQLEEHMAEVGVVADINRWGESLVLGVVDPHDSLSHPAGVSDVQAESATRLDPDQFTNFLIPHWFVDEFPGSTKCNPFPLPDVYLSSQQRNLKNLLEVKQTLKETPLEDNRKRELLCALHAAFKDWLYASGNIRQLYCLQAD